MKTPRYTYDMLKNEFPNDDICLEYIFQQRYGHLEFCPNCAAQTKFYRIKLRKYYKCAHCAFELYPLAGTIFHKSETPLTKWFFAIFLFSNSKNGVSAKELERHLGVTYKTAWRIARLIRQMMDEHNVNLTGIVEADETYYGGRGKHWRGPRGKTPIIGAVERGGRVEAQVVPYATRKTAEWFIEKYVSQEAEMHTDESRIYHHVSRKRTHEAINHSKGEYARENVTTNSIEGFWSQLKRSLDGTYHSVSPKYLPLYVNEFEYRYNHRHVAVLPLLMAMVSKPIRETS
jgi:transposase-like protein